MPNATSVQALAADQANVPAPRGVAIRAGSARTLNHKYSLRRYEKTLRDELTGATR